MIRYLVGVAVVSAALCAGSASAQGSPPEAVNRTGDRGFSVGVNLSGSRLMSAVEQGPNPSRGGVGFTLRYGVSDAVSAFLRYEYGYQHGQTSLGARYTFGSAGQRLRPYLEGGVSRVGMVDGERHATGRGITGAAGVEYALSRSVALDLGLTHSSGRIIRAELGGEAAGFRDRYQSTGLAVGFRLKL